MRKHGPILAAALAGVALSLAACGTETPSAGGGGTPESTDSSLSASPSSAASTPTHEPRTSRPTKSSSPAHHSRIMDRCHTGQLSASVKPRDSAAGHRHAWLVLRNTSQTTCTIYGYGGMQLYRSGGKAVPTKMVRDPSVPPRLLTLAPGATARSSISWTVVPTGGEPAGKACEPTGTTAHVTPPDETDYLGIAWHYGQVCDKGTINQGAYRGTATGAGS